MSSVLTSKEHNLRAKVMHRDRFLCRGCGHCQATRVFRIRECKSLAEYNDLQNYEALCEWCYYSAAQQRMEK